MEASINYAYGPASQGMMTSTLARSMTRKWKTYWTTLPRLLRRLTRIKPASTNMSAEPKNSRTSEG